MRTRPRINHPWKSISVTEVETIDARLARLGRGTGAMRLQIGEGLLRMDEVDGVRALGFPNLESYAREALGRSGRWGSDARSLARRLAHLPRLRSAMVTAELATSMVELLARVATPDDEAEWIERARTLTIREMRALLKADRLAELESDDADPPKSTITTTVDRIDAWAFERTRLMVEALGATRGEGTIEAMLAEGLTEIIATNPDIGLPSGLTGSAIESSRAFRAEISLVHEQCEAAVDSMMPPEIVEAVSPSDMPTELDWPSRDDDHAAEEIDTLLRATARELAWRDLELAHLARRAADFEIWRVLRFTSFEHYCRDRIGLAPSAIASRIALTKRVAVLPEIEAAVIAGRIGYASASIVARIAGPSTVDEWLDRAAARTVKHLREEVDAIEMLARAEDGDARRIAPPDAELLADIHQVERAAVASITNHMSGGSPVTNSPASTTTNLPKTTLRFSLSEDTARFWRSLERLHGQLKPDTSFVAFLVRAVLKSWSGSVPARGAYAHIYHRDRWRCASPVCRSRSVTPHHIIFRSRGGSDDPGNLISLCETCHLELLHGHRLALTGDAGRALTWRASGWRAIGRDATAPRGAESRSVGT